MNEARSLWLLVSLLGLSATATATEETSVLVLREPGFPTSDSAAPSDKQLADARDARLDLIDKPTGVRIELVLASQHAALAVVDGGSRKLVARYGC